MNIVIDPLTGFYIVSALVLFSLTLAAYPTLRERAKKGR